MGGAPSPAVPLSSGDSGAPQAIGDSAHLPPGPGAPEELFAVRVLAHRLRLPVGTIARKVMSGWDADAADLKIPCVVCGEDHEQTGSSV